MKKNGFTLVELMVVVIVIGILAAVSMPKFQSAADKTKVAEVSQILNSIAGAQEQYILERGIYLPLDNDAGVWKKVGLKIPDSKYFKYAVEADSLDTIRIDDENPLRIIKKPEFTAKAELLVSLTRAKRGDTVTINEKGEKYASPELNKLISSFGATPK